MNFTALYACHFIFLRRQNLALWTLRTSCTFNSDSATQSTHLHIKTATFLSPIIMSLRDLRVNSLYVTLFIRQAQPVPDGFHWGLYLHLPPGDSGIKYHLKSLANGWIADRGTTCGIFKSFLLFGLIRIADVPATWINHVDGVLRSYDNRLNNTPGITCRLWLFWVLELLRKPVNNYRFLKCDDLTTLEQEIMTWGNRYAHDTSQNVQPRLTHDSTLCQLQLE